MPNSNLIPDCCAYPSAAGTPESGTGITKSAEISDSRANSAPIILRAL